MPTNSLTHREPAELLALARHSLAAAMTQPDDRRYVSSYVAASFAAFALIAHRKQPATGAGVWELFEGAAPEYQQWANRWAAEARITATVTARMADDMVDTAQRFVDLIARDLGDAQ